MNTIDLLNYWLNLTNFDENKSVFHLFSDDWKFNDRNKKLIKFFNEWDSSGTIPLLYAKFLFNDLIQSKTFTLYDFLENNIKDVEEITHLYNEFNSEKFTELESNLIKSFEILLTQLNIKNLLGDLNAKDLLICAQNVLEEILKLNVDVYKKGGIIKPFENFSNKIHVFDTVSQCLLTLEHSIDGVYLCYIIKENSPDGYFGFYIKNNGNLFSINERISERYIGQHKSMRNNRWTEDKAYDLFPYEIFNFEGEDYKGYATVHKIDKSKLTFDHLEISTLMNIIVMLFLLNKKYSNTLLTDEIVYVDSLFDINVKTALDFNKNELVPYTNNSSLIKKHNEFNIEFSSLEFLNGTLCNKFNRSSGKRYDEYGSFQNINQGMVDKFGKDFNLFLALNDVFETDRTKLLLDSDVNSEITVKDDYIFNNEFIGNKNKMELQAFFTARKKLAQHIIDKQVESFEKFGGLEKLKEWYEAKLLENLPKIKNLCIQVYRNKELGIRYYYDTFRFGEPSKISFDWIKYSNLDCKESISYMTINPHIHNINQIVYPYEWGDKIQSKDLTNQKECYHFFRFIFMNLQHLREFFEIEFPDFCEGYYGNGYGFKPYTGNSILDVVDPVDELTSILCYKNKNYKFNFDFCIGFSKSNFNKLLKTIK